MDARTTSLEEFLEAVLRGAAKILGCSSANLILINEPTGQIRVRLGTRATSFPILAQLEEVLGDSFRGISFPMEQAADSLICRCWRDQAIRETSSLEVLVGSALSSQAVQQMEQLIGEHRYVCVPALSGSRNYGVILFEKEGAAAFSRQQSEVALHFARRIGEILEGDLMGQGQLLISRSWSGQEYLLFDAGGTLVGRGPGNNARVVGYLNETTLRSLGQRARQYLLSEEVASDGGEQWLEADLRVSFSRISLTAGDHRTYSALCALRTSGPRAEVSLENQLLHLTLGAPAPALFVDPDFCVTSCNEAAVKLLGCAADTLIGRPVGQLFTDADQVLTILDRQLLDPESPYGEQSATIVTHDGSLAPARVEAMLLADEMHRLVGFMLLLRADQADGGEATERLVRQERLATMGEMTAQLAHELRNPLVAVGATLESLSRDPDQRPEQRLILASLNQEIARMDMTLKDHLAAARNELSFARVGVAELLHESCRLLEGGRNAGRQLEVEVDHELVMRVDRDAMKHVFFNLLLNALEATPAGGTVSCTAELGASHLSIVVQDSGHGLKASAEECSQPFFTTKKNGSGLGLAVCHKIVRSHGGLVSIGDCEQGGCRVEVVLPRAALR